MIYGNYAKDDHNVGHEEEQRLSCDMLAAFLT